MWRLPQGMLDDAIMTYKEAIAREPNFPEAYNNLVCADAYLAVGIDLLHDCVADTPSQENALRQITHDNDIYRK